MSASELIREASEGASGFGHREHVRLAWLAVRRHDLDRASDVVSDTLRETARYAGAPQKYHETVSRAWVEIVAHRVAVDPTLDWDAFLERNSDLLDKGFLRRHYSSRLLASAPARSGWVEPDREALPAAGRS